MININGKYCSDCVILIDDVEEDAMSNIMSMVNDINFANSKIRIMPDVHSGKGCTIGTTYTIGDSINPSHVGVDIGCMVSLYITNTSVNKLDFELIEHRIKTEIPFGQNYYKTCQCDKKEFFKYLRSYYNSQRSLAPSFINDVFIDEKYISSMLKRIKMDEGVFYKSIGTVGGGNHYIEINEYNNNYAFSIHCGSRNFGAKIGNYWISIANNQKLDKKSLKQAIKEITSSTENKYDIPRLIQEYTEKEKNKLNIGFLSGDNMTNYLTDMVIASAYARFNHEIISRKIIDILQHINGAKIVDEIHSVHNYVDFQDMMVRKGAIRAHLDEKILVPLNMRDGVVIARGLGNENWNQSCSHGAGRKMSRSKAKSSLSMDEFKDTMKDIYTTSVCFNTIDESPMAYKDSDVILNLIQDTCQILYVAKPLINLKSTDIE